MATPFDDPASFLEYLTKSLESRYAHAIDYILHVSNECIQRKNLLRGQIIRSPDVERISSDGMLLSDIVTAALHSLSTDISKRDEAIDSLKERCTQESDETAPLRSALEEHKERKGLLVESRASLEKKFEEYGTKKDIYACLHPVRISTPDVQYDAFRLVLPVPLERANVQGTLSEQLVNLIYTEFIQDPLLGEDQLENVHRVITVFPSGRKYLGIDVIYSIESDTLDEVRTYIKEKAESIVNSAHSHASKNLEVLVASPFIAETPFTLTVLASPLTYESFALQGLAKFNTKKQEIRKKAERLFAAATTPEMRITDTQKETLIDKLCGVIGEEFKTDLTNVQQEALAEVYQRFNDYLSSLVKDPGFIPPRVFTPSPQGISFAQETLFPPLEIIDGRICISLDDAARLVRLPQAVLSRGYSTGTLTPVTLHDRDYIPLRQFFDLPNKLTFIGKSVHLLDGSASTIRRFCESNNLDRDIFEDGRKANKITVTPVYYEPRDDAVPRLRAFVVMERDAERVLGEYRTYRQERQIQ